MARAYYNENDPTAAAWLRALIAGGHIAPGDVDERSIVEVQPDDRRVAGGDSAEGVAAGLGAGGRHLRPGPTCDVRAVMVPDAMQEAA